VRCSGAPGDAAPPEADIVYVGQPTDEALAYLEALDPVPSPNELVVESPAASTKLTAEQFEIRYSEPSQADLERSLKDSSRSARVRVARAPSFVVRWTGSWVQEAHGHGVPYSGVGYFLEVRDRAGARVLGVFTDQFGYAPTFAERELLRAAGALELRITSAYFEQNEVTADGGPFERAKVPFEVL